MKRILSVLAALALAVGMSAQSLRVDESTYHWESGAMLGFNNNGYEWDFRVAYFPIPYFGIRLSLGMAGEIPALEDWDSGYPFSEYGVPEKDNYITHTGFIAMSYKF